MSKAKIRNISINIQNFQI